MNVRLAGMVLFVKATPPSPYSWDHANGITREVCGSRLGPRLPTSGQILGGVWVRSWGELVVHLGARGCELAIESRTTMPIMVTAWDIGIDRRKISLMNACVPR